jgi:hypothetical protein
MLEPSIRSLGHIHARIHWLPSEARLAAKADWEREMPFSESGMSARLGIDLPSTDLAYVTISRLLFADLWWLRTPATLTVNGLLVEVCPLLTPLKSASREFAVALHSAGQTRRSV